MEDCVVECKREKKKLKQKGANWGVVANVVNLVHTQLA